MLSLRASSHRRLSPGPWHLTHRPPGSKRSYRFSHPPHIVAARSASLSTKRPEIQAEAGGPSDSDGGGNHSGGNNDDNNKSTDAEDEPENEFNYNGWNPLKRCAPAPGWHAAEPLQGQPRVARSSSWCLGRASGHEPARARRPT